VNSILISKNTFRQSNHKCIVVEGTSNIIISGNIGYQTFGECIYMGVQSHSNLVTGNLISDARKLNGIATGFANWYGPNDFTHNIAVGGER